MSNLLKTKYFAYLLVVILGFSSFQFNLFRFADPVLIENHDPVSRAIVLEGVAWTQETGAPPRVGKLVIDETGKVVGDERVFAPYRSQFGPQVWVIERLFGGSVDATRAGLALAMSLVVLLFFIGTQQEFGGLYAAIFCASLITAPWVIMFATHIYWFSFLLFLPAAIAFALGRKAVGSKYANYATLSLLFCAFFFKFLCGYEYVTTLGISTVVPIVYFSLKYDSNKWKWLFRSIQVFTMFILAFVCAIIAHSIRLNEPSIKEGVDVIFSEVAMRRIATTGEVEGRIGDAQATPYTTLLLRYYMAPSMLPYLNAAFEESERAVLRETSDMLNRREFSAVYKSLLGVSLKTKLFIAGMFLGAAFLCLLTFFSAMLVIIRPQQFLLPIGLALLAPISWFLGAKGHSGIHYQLNYVLWYLPFIPFNLMLVLKHSKDIKLYLIQKLSWKKL